MEEKLREVVAILREHTPLSKLTEQEGYEVIAWAEANLERGQSGEMGAAAPLASATKEAIGLSLTRYSA